MRSDAKLVALGLVINPEDFIKYLFVSRSGLKIYNIEAPATTVSVTDNRKQKIELCQVNSDRNTDYHLKVEYKYAPFVKRKSVVHKSELEKCQFIEKQKFRSD